LSISGLDTYLDARFVLGGWNTMYAIPPYQFSAESDLLSLSGGTVDVGTQGGNINSLSPNSRLAPFSTNSLSIYGFGDPLCSLELKLFCRHIIVPIYSPFKS
jgi:hypothetical protein